jgi:hypothetical protein
MTVYLGRKMLVGEWVLFFSLLAMGNLQLPNPQDP